MLDSVATDCAGIKERTNTDETLSVKVNIEFIAEQTARIESSIQGLEQRLQSVMRTSDSRMEKDKKTEGESCVLAGELSDLGNRLIGIAEKIEDVSNRLEI